MRIIILREFVLKMRKLGYRIIAATNAKRHLHALVSLPNEYARMKREVGKCKQKASHAVRKLLPGSIWAGGAEFVRIEDRGHLHNSYGYIREKQEAGAAVWSHRADENWIDDPNLGIIVMVRGRRSIRVFGVTSDTGVGWRLSISALLFCADHFS